MTVGFLCSRSSDTNDKALTCGYLMGGRFQNASSHVRERGLCRVQVTTRLTGCGLRLPHVLAVGTSVRTGDVWVVDSNPVECARSRETVERSDLAG
jgi:hypothetical protein